MLCAVFRYGCSLSLGNSSMYLQDIVKSLSQLKASRDVSCYLCSQHAAIGCEEYRCTQMMFRYHAAPIGGVASFVTVAEAFKARVCWYNLPTRETLAAYQHVRRLSAVSAASIAIVYATPMSSHLRDIRSCVPFLFTSKQACSSWTRQHN